MRLKALASLFSSKRFWVWQIGGTIIYALPVLIRIATGDVLLPGLSLLAVPWIDHYVPGNLVEKILVNAFFPGGAGAVAGEILYSNLHREGFTRRQKYLARLGGALIWVTGWSLFQLWGNLQNIMGSYGGNLFEYPMVFPLNFALASLSIFTPNVVAFIKNRIANAHSKLKR
jgi:hypothetical protein